MSHSPPCCGWLSAALGGSGMILAQQQSDENGRAVLFIMRFSLCRSKFLFFLFSLFLLYFLLTHLLDRHSSHINSLLLINIFISKTSCHRTLLNYKTKDWPTCYQHYSCIGNGDSNCRKLLDYQNYLENIIHKIIMLKNVEAYGELLLFLHEHPIGPIN